MIRFFSRTEYMLKSNMAINLNIFMIANFNQIDRWTQAAPTIRKDIKHQLMISGCSSRAYWISMLIWDWCQCKTLFCQVAK